MVDRMVNRSFLTAGKYVSVHLRFEEVLQKFISWPILLFFSLVVIVCTVCLGYGGFLMLRI